MKEQVERWLRQARHDLNSASRNREIGLYDVTLRLTKPMRASMRLQRKTTKPDKQVRLLLSKYWEKIDQLYSPEAVWLFGSRASGEVSSDSDIDLVA